MGSGLEINLHPEFRLFVSLPKATNKPSFNYCS
jgi:hypothetical protein